MADGKAADQPAARIALVSASFGYGGDLMYYGEIFRALRERLPGIFVCVDRRTAYGNPYRLPLAPILSQALLRRVRHLPNGAAYDASISVVSPLFALRLLRRKPDVVVVLEFGMAALWGALVARLRKGARLVLLVEGDPAERGARGNPIVTAIKRSVARHADAIQTNAEAGRYYLTAELGVSDDKITVAPYLTSEPPRPLQTEPSKAGESDSHRLRLLFLNSLTERKGLDRLLRALALLEPGELERVRLEIVGNGPLGEAMQGLAQELGIAENVRFLGHFGYSELGRYLANADVLVVPSLADYRSLSSFEGLNYGLALLVSIHDGASRETVHEGETGFTFDPSDPAELAAGIRGFIADPALLERCKQGSRALGSSSYSAAAVADNLARTIAGVLPG